MGELAGRSEFAGWLAAGSSLTAGSALTEAAGGTPPGRWCQLMFGAGGGRAPAWLRARGDSRGQQLARHEAAQAADEGPKIALNEVELKTIDGKYRSLFYYMDMALLIVNVASKCGLTPQYTGLQRLQDRFGDKGFSVLGFPCNQFGLQEPGGNDEIVEFCSTQYGVKFPMFDKIEVNGPGQHPLYAQLTNLPDEDGQAGDVEWNFEKFLVSPDLEVVRRWRPTRDPESNTIVAAIKSHLP